MLAPQHVMLRWTYLPARAYLPASQLKAYNMWYSTGGGNLPKPPWTLKNSSIVGLILGVKGAYRIFILLCCSYLKISFLLAFVSNGNKFDNEFMLLSQKVPLLLANFHLNLKSHNFLLVKFQLNLKRYHL